MFYKNRYNLISHKLYEKSFISENEKCTVSLFYYLKYNIINRCEI